MFAQIKQRLISRGYWDENPENTGGNGGAGDDAKARAEAEAKAKAEAEAKAKADAEANSDPNKPSDKEAQLLKELMQIKNKSKEDKAKLAELQDKLDKFANINLDEVNALLNEKKTAEQKKLEEQGQWESLKKQMSEENDKIVKAHAEKNTELSQLVKSQQELIDKLTLGNAFGNSKFIQESLNLSPQKARILYGDHFEFVDGEVVGYDKPRGAKDRVELVNASGENLSFDDAIKKLIESDPDKDKLLKSPAKQGSNSGTSGSNFGKDDGKKELKGIGKIHAGLVAQGSTKK